MWFLCLSNAGSVGQAQSARRRRMAAWPRLHASPRPVRRGGVQGADSFLSAVFRRRRSPRGCHTEMHANTAPAHARPHPQPAPWPRTLCYLPPILWREGVNFCGGSGRKSCDKIRPSCLSSISSQRPEDLLRIWITLPADPIYDSHGLPSQPVPVLGIPRGERCFATNLEITEGPAAKGWRRRPRSWRAGRL